MFCPFNSNAIGKAKVEGKHRFFTWLLVQQKISTADNFLVKGIMCDPVCALCSQEVETADHLCLHCVFAQVWSENLIAVPNSGVSLVVWWNSEPKSKPKDKMSRIISIMIYTF
jgi:hypothetical protein